MKTTYKKEPGKSFLIVEPEGSQKEFAIQMLLENQIQGLLDFDKRTFNGETLFYYDISGKHTIESVLEIRLLSEKQLRKLFQSLYCLVETLYAYFLDPGGIVLDFRYIYEDAQSCFFCYDPSVTDTEIEKNMVSFMEELLGYVDHDDEKAVMTAYRLYRMVKEEDKNLLQMLQDVLSEEIKEIQMPDCEDKGGVFENETILEEIDFWRQNAEDAPEMHLLKKKYPPDLCTAVCFALLFIVGLFFVFYKNYIIAVICFILSGLGGFSAFVDIDIKRKK